ncbi:MAG TPA: hypothetical protein VN812_17530 [Candidatus Acidoferrales bacterium]|nr:hypothetical protein [Candidatus Acidoferrales bacterium]
MRHRVIRSLMMSLVALGWLAGGAGTAAARRCGSDPSDGAALLATQDQVAQQCDCSTSTRHVTYVKCAKQVAQAAVKGGTLARACTASIRQCAMGSSCGTPFAAAPACFVPSPTSTPSPTPTPTIPAVCIPAQPLPDSLIEVPVTLDPGTSNCGGPMPGNGASAPLVGGVDDGVGNGAGLGLGCLYVGGLPAVQIPSGSTSILHVTGISGQTLTLGPGTNTDPTTCTSGAGPFSHCLNGAAGVDGSGGCTSDADCNRKVGACALDANCYFGPPIPVPQGVVSACSISAFATDMCGAVDVSSNTTVLTTSLSARLYLTGNADSPCPQCVGGGCVGGKNDGKACTALGSDNTSIDCPPEDKQFLGVLDINFPAITTGESGLHDTNGELCPGQTQAGAFGWLDARNINLKGSPLLSSTSDLFSETIVSTFCVPSSHNGLLDSSGGLPAAGALSAKATLDLSQALPLLH